MVHDRDCLVELNGVWKKFCRDLRTSLRYGVCDLWREVIGQQVDGALRPREFWALRDISFTLRRHEALGIIGPNGAGKSTLLKLLVGLIKPTKGQIRMRGRVQALIDLNAGFSPILTGRENIYVSGALFGLSKREIDRRFDEIVDFAELAEYIDMPVRSYSSGMKVRLGFAVAVNVRPDILIIDEVLAVGDQRFRRKARNAMERLLQSDIALIFISHNIHEVMGITQRALWLDRGQMVRLGDAASVCAEYLHQADLHMAGHESLRASGGERLVYMPKRTGDMTLVGIRCLISDQVFGRHVVCAGPDERVTLELTFEARTVLNEAVLHGFDMVTADGLPVGHVVLNDYLQANPGERVVRSFVLDVSLLRPGGYRLAYEMGTEGGPRLEGVENLVALEIKPRTWLPLNQGNGVNHARSVGTLRGALLLPVTFVDPRGVHSHSGDSLASGFAS
jgi:ABC-type polysaccharide/polyol phosphate transport system ATPase subunit